MKKQVLVLFCILMLTIGAHADLILNIDTVTKEVFFTGTDIIRITEDPYGGGYYNWKSSGYSLENKIQERYVTGPESSAGLNFTVLSFTSDGEMNLLFHHTVSSPISGSFFSLEGTGARSDYDIGFPEIVDFLDNYSGEDLDPIQQSGGRPRTISVQVVPEPTTALLFGVGLIGVQLIRRNRKIL